ncbi:uncharacterized protein PV06_08038 [Exophiala oligosperma]|uniref:aldehyde dehydrogenase (NAD(+)) n=1 Tax=Exophiala oligosperma TaxID=215243 RepID=A0A0D2DZ70_9EURO|nr:uncharacterized protein PV06_08038 [Exophiala oligosperma]KIW40869.1 hypothetical protein PV06_08038 [Exophiala oligosperma]
MAARSSFKCVALKLGGKSHVVIFDDCDLKNAVKWTVEGLCNFSGQVCVAASRVFVQEDEKVYMKEYVNALQVSAGKVGNPTAVGTEFGPLADKAQFDRISGFVEPAQKGP